MTWTNISYVLRSPLSRKILECLSSSKEPLTPLQMSKKTNIAQSNVSTKLVELRKRKMVECVNPEDRKWRFYKITKDGKRYLGEAKRLLKS